MSNEDLLLKAAEAKRLSGDAAGADQLFAEWEKTHAQHPFAWMHRAQWDYTSGRKAEAESRMKANGSPLALVQLTVWKLEQGDRAAAEAMLAEAAAKAGDAPSNRNAVAFGITLCT